MVVLSPSTYLYIEGMIALKDWASEPQDVGHIKARL